MLVRYKKSLEKIAMGLLSLMPEEKEVKHLMETMQKYEEKEDWQLFLWKNDDEYVGIIGISLIGSVATVQHLTVLPNYRGEGIAQSMVKALFDLDQVDEITSNESTAQFVGKCLQSIQKDGTN